MPGWGWWVDLGFIDGGDDNFVFLFSIIGGANGLFRRECLLSGRFVRFPGGHDDGKRTCPMGMASFDGLHAGYDNYHHGSGWLMNLVVALTLGDCHPTLGDNARSRFDGRVLRW